MTVQFTNQRPFRVLIPFLEMPAIFHEIQIASAQMTSRQALFTEDGGAEMLRELCRLALRPTHIDGMIDRRSGDRTYVMQFADHAPLAIRLTPAEAQSLRVQMEYKARLQAN